MSKYLRTASIAALSVFALAVLVQSAESRGGFGGGGGFHGSGFRGGGGAFRSGFVGARGFQSGFSGRGMRVGHVAGISRGGFNRTAGFSRREFSRSAMSGSRSFTSRGFATRSFTGSAGSRAVKGRQLASSALAGRNSVTGALASRNGNLMRGSVRGGRTCCLFT